MSICFLFPGQGSQKPGMLKDLPPCLAVKETIGKASTILALDTARLDTEESLRTPEAVQLCLFIAGVASARALEETDVHPAAVAGMSVGAFAAAVISGTLSFGDGLLIVKKRAKLMQNTFPTGYGMSAIVGLSEKTINKLVAANQTQGPLFVSNINSPTQIVVSGAVAALETMEQAALQNGAQKAERLNTTSPSHCALFHPAAKSLSLAFEQVKLSPPIMPYISNLRARPLKNPQTIADDLARNIAGPVRWHDSVAVLVDLGCELFIEMQPGNVLSRLGSANFASVRFISLEGSSLSAVRQLAQKRSQ